MAVASSPQTERAASRGWLFRANASPREKAFTLCALGWMVVAIYGMATSFVAEAWVTKAAAYAALPLCLFIFIPVLLDRHPSNKMRTYGLFKKFSLYLVLLAFSYALSWIGLAMGSTSLVTRFFGVSFAGEYRVTWKSDGRWRRRECDYFFRLQDTASDWNTKACVSRQFWAMVHQGDVLVSRGKRSAFGTMLLEASLKQSRRP
jgi:hypothetical protein